MIAPTGVIYQYVDGPALPSQVLVEAFKPHTVHVVSRAAIKRTLTGLVAGSIVGIGLLVSPLLVIEARYRMLQARDTPPQQAVQQAIAGVQPYATPPPRTIVSAYNIDISPAPIATPSPQFAIDLTETYKNTLNPINTDFSIVIPKIGVNSAIIPDVDAANEAEYREALFRGVAHAKGTSLPGENGTTYIFAHSTDYAWNVNRFNAVFYLLKEMHAEDEVYIVYANKVFPYVVSEVRIVDPDDTSYLIPKYGQEELVLQTCWPPGTVNKRLLVIAHPKT